ncbi:uncharacterized protein LOC120337403 [Styela clava]
MASSSASWVKFFKDAGIPADQSAKYAVMFSDHRIQKGMLGDLDRDILSDIGIKAVGDKMAIMKHAKFVDDQTKRDASSKILADGIKTLENRTSKGSSPAQRMINHSINSRSPSGRNSPKIVVENAEKPKNFAEDFDPRKTVFDRLGVDSPNKSPSKSSGIFKRLGGELPSEELPYAGILKKPSSPVTTKKKILIVKKAKSTSVLDRLGVQKSPPQVVKKPVTVTMAKKVVSIKKKPVAVATTTSPTKVLIKRNVETTKTGIKRSSNVLDRLGDIVTSTTKQTEEATEESPAVKRKLIVVGQKKKPATLKRKSTGDIREKISAKKPISSNTVSSTSSAGIFKGAAQASSSVFARLGAK